MEADLLDLLLEAGDVSFKFGRLFYISPEQRKGKESSKAAHREIGMK